MDSRKYSFQPAARTNILQTGSLVVVCLMSFEKSRTFLDRLLKLGASENDDEALRLKKSSLLLVPLIIGPAAFIWGIVYLVLDHVIASAIPLSYSVISVINLWHLHKTKDIVPLQNIQLILVLLLPFFLM